MDAQTPNWNIYPRALPRWIKNNAGRQGKRMSPNSPTLQQLHRLDSSSPEFHDQLCNVLYGEEYVKCVPNLEGDDSVWLVDYLDKALDGLDPSSPASRKCLRELRSVCGTRAILPTSYTLSSPLLKIGSEPFASGGYGDVYEGTLGRLRVCIKRVRVYTRDGPEKAAKTFCQEAIMWKRLTHPNIVPLLGITITSFQLISNWMPGGCLPEYIKKRSDANLLRLLSDVAKGLCYLHSCNVIHGDLKGPNILIDDSGHARITDFGLAKVTLNLDSIRSPQCQNGHTPRWTAPEVLNEEPCSKEADIFSFAMVMVEVFTGEIPFNSRSPPMIILAITQGERPPRPAHLAFTDDLWTLMQRCWDHDPHLRPEVSEALQVLSTPNIPAWKQLISHPLAMDKRISMITAIFSDHNQAKMVERLYGNDAQIFIDTIDGVLDSLPPHIHRRCLRSIYRICGRQALLPKSLVIPLCFDPMTSPLYHGGFADVWKGQYRGREVAAKVLRVYLSGDVEKVRRRFCREVITWKTLRHPNVLPLLGVTMTHTRFVMVSEWMVNGTINEFVKADSNADRLGLLRDATKGSIYLHDRGLVHGDLKGANILINNDCHACLSDFGMLAIASDHLTLLSSFMGGGTIQWMSPELLNPEGPNPTGVRPTKQSDCYALGRVVYEVLSGQLPFPPRTGPVVIRKVLEGELPERPQGEGGVLFTDAIWTILEKCWKHSPGDRVSAKDILSCLEGYPPSERPSSFNVDGDLEAESNDQQDAISSSSGQSIVGSDDGLPVPPHSHPPRAISPTIAPQKLSKGGWVSRLLGNVWIMAKRASPC